MVFFYTEASSGVSSVCFVRLHFLTKRIVTKIPQVIANTAATPISKMYIWSAIAQDADACSVAGTLNSVAGSVIGSVSGWVSIMVGSGSTGSQGTSKSQSTNVPTFCSVTVSVLLSGSNAASKGCTDKSSVTAYSARLLPKSSGTVSFTDMYDQTWVTLDEVDKAGIKANLCRPIQCFDPNETYEDNFRSKESIKLYHDINAMNNSRIKADFSIHAEYTNHPHIVAAYAEECNKLGGRVHLHLSETKKEHEECKQRHGKTPARFFYDLGTMDIPVIAAHCVWVDDEDLDLLKEKNN